jgi:hypothetical protein
VQGATALQGLQTQTFEGQASVPPASTATESSDKNDLSGLQRCKLGSEEIIPVMAE